ncbi:hypothetical protein AC578_4610 [Pseudocercospora eumusae]|uniref:Kynurenine formamidase n=1 Tax=Pseudocercospora eumusae TaxID=321146 RepID=A0A139H4X3_9PEZI|nr:hypothetical protein AC578_4610 [Pseudocercospora eumusae]
MAMAVSDEWPQFRKDMHYSDDSKLNTLQTCIPKPTSSNDQSRIWVVYVHGGAWFDPEQTATTFDKAQDILLKSPELHRIAGFASINYRLSPASCHPTHPSNPADPARNATHPDHINDVLSAILHLQETYRFEHRYILVAMKRYWGLNYQSTQALELNVVPPLAICGIEGLYDLPALVKYHDKLDQSLYRNFTEAAFGTSEQGWAAASPTQGDYKANWEDGKLVVIAHSREDELVEWEQAELMLSCLQKQGFTESGDRRLKLLQLEGKHDQVWKEGQEVARAIEYTIKELVSLES